MLAREAPVPGVPLDHEVLLTLLTSKGIDDGLEARGILDSPFPHIVSLKGRVERRRNPYTAISRSARRLQARGFCAIRESRWHSVNPSPHYPMDLVTYFVRCTETCSRDHFKDFILSDYQFRLAKQGGFLDPLVHLLARIIVYTAHRLKNLDEELDRWLDDIVSRAASLHAADLDLGAFRNHLRSRLGELKQRLKAGTREDQVVATEDLLRQQELEMVSLFVPVNAMPEHVRLSAAASSRFWRQLLDKGPVADPDFEARPVSPPLVGKVTSIEGKYADGAGVTNPTFGNVVTGDFVGLMIAWLKQDSDEDYMVGQRLEQMGWRLSIADVGTKIDVRLERLEGLPKNEGTQRFERAE